MQSMNIHSSDMQLNAWQQAKTVEDCEYIIEKNSKLMDKWLAYHKPTFIMCKPTYFKVDKGNDTSGEVAGNGFVNKGYTAYFKNPEKNHALMLEQWQALHDLFIAKGADVILTPPQAEYPDQVYTADHLFSLDYFCDDGEQLSLQKALTIFSRLAHPNRTNELDKVKQFFDMLVENGSHQKVLSKREIIQAKTYFEGIGDNLLDTYRGIILSGYGLRNTETALHDLAATTGLPLYSIINKKPFFHIDTSFSVLPNGYVMYAPDAMYEESVQTLEAALFKSHAELKDKYAITVPIEDAYHFACNAVMVGKSIIIQECSNELKDKLAAKGLDVTYTNASIANMAGGGLHCMSNMINQPVFV